MERMIDWVSPAADVLIILVVAVYRLKQVADGGITTKVLVILELFACYAAISSLYGSIFTGLERTIGHSLVLTVIGLVVTKALLIAAGALLVTLRGTHHLQPNSETEYLLVALYACVIIAFVNGSFRSEAALLKALVLFIILIFVMFVYDRSSQQVATVKEGDELKRITATEQEYLRRIEDNHRHTREIWHDLNNHLNCMNILLKEEKYSELASYLDSFGATVQATMLPVRTGNMIADAVLGDKYNTARKHNIRIHFALSSLSGIHVEAGDLCTILGNALDNAIEATCKINDPDQRWIEIKTAVDGTRLLISVANPIAELPQANHGEYVTTKPDPTVHGLGLRCIRRIAEKYDGEVVCGSDKGIFTIMIKLDKPASG